MVWGQCTVAAPKCKSLRDPSTWNYINAFDERTESIQRSKVHNWKQSCNQAQGFPKITSPLTRQHSAQSILPTDPAQDWLTRVYFYPCSSQHRLDWIMLQSLPTKCWRVEPNFQKINTKQMPCWKINWSCTLCTFGSRVWEAMELRERHCSHSAWYTFIYQQAAQIISFPAVQYPVIPSLLYSFFLYQTDALKCYAAVSSWISLTWQPKGVLRNESLVPTENVSRWWYSLISLINRPQYQPHCIFHKTLPYRMHFSIYFYTEWISDKVKQIPKALCYCHLSVKWFLYQTVLKVKISKQL